MMARTTPVLFIWIQLSGLLICYLYIGTRQHRVSTYTQRYNTACGVEGFRAKLVAGGGCTNVLCSVLFQSGCIKWNRSSWEFGRRPNLRSAAELNH